MEKTLRQIKIERVKNNRHQGIIVLEDIHDPHNAAAVWRSADCFGFGKIYIIFDQEKVFNPKKVGKASSSSANKWLDFEIFKSTEECYAKLKRDGYKIYATILDENAKDLHNIEFGGEKNAFVFGNEHRGISKMAAEGADEKIYIPMLGMVQSLNLSVTAGIVMWEYRRQKFQSTPNPLL
ncbi:MAG: RNA methyltransferase [Candidatus Shapirobacteria bacterium]